MLSFGIFGRVLVAAAVVSAASTFATAQTAQKYRPPVAGIEGSVSEQLPPGFSIQPTDVDGPVFVDARGMTLYTWPYRGMALGGIGDRQGKPSACSDTKITETTGEAAIYPRGLILPDLDTRPTCAHEWPAVLAAPDAKPVGRWTVMDRPDGKKQWAYGGQPLYTSVLDTKPGQVNGGFRRPLTEANSPPAFRVPVGPAPLLPPGFSVRTTATGRILANNIGGVRFVVYSSEGDRPNVSNCKGDCLKDWGPLLAAEAAHPQGDWGVVERSPGVRQWTYRSMPLYTYLVDKKRINIGERGTSFLGSDVPGWRPVFTQKWPDPPKEFKIQDSRIGQVLADKNGMTLYTYTCADDAEDQLLCDHPTQTQVYRLAICGQGDPAACNKLFPYALAPKDAKVDNMIWGTAWIDPMTGHYAKADAPGAVHVWTFRDRPIYTHGRDKKPGDANGDAWGEGNGIRNGYRAFWIRDDFFASAG